MLNFHGARRPGPTRAREVGRPGRRARPDSRPTSRRRACPPHSGGATAERSAAPPYTPRRDVPCGGKTERGSERGSGRKRRRVEERRSGREGGVVTLARPPSIDTSTREMWCGSHDGGQRVPGRREDPPGHREHRPQESHHVSTRVSPLASFRSRKPRLARACFACPVSPHGPKDRNRKESARPRCAKSPPPHRPSFRRRQPDALPRADVRRCRRFWTRAQNVAADVSRLAARLYPPVHFPPPFPNPNRVRATLTLPLDSRSGAREENRTTLARYTRIIDLKSPRSPRCGGILT